jgi:hypothetical protein
VDADLAFLVEDRDACVGLALLDAPGGGEPDDAGADDRVVGYSFVHGREPSSR